MLENWKTLATWSPQPLQVAKVGGTTFVADYSQGTTQYTQVQGSTKKKVSFAEILGYAATLGDTAVKVINSLKAPTSGASTGLDLTGLSLEERQSVADLKAEADANVKRRQRNVLITVGAGLLLLVALGFYLKSKK